MMSEFGSFRFGWDAPSRIGASAVMLQEAIELLPGRPTYAHAITLLSSDRDGSRR